MINISKGKITAFIFITTTIIFLWGFCFTPKGLGSNILLGFFLAVYIIYILTIFLGKKLDEKLFHRGNPDKIKLINKRLP